MNIYNFTFPGNASLKNLFLLFFLFVFVTNGTCAPVPNQKFEAGNKEYRFGNYEKAIGIYEQLVKDGFRSSTLYNKRYRD